MSFQQRTLKICLEIAIECMEREKKQKKMRRWFISFHFIAECCKWNCGINFRYFGMNGVLVDLRISPQLTLSNENHRCVLSTKKWEKKKRKNQVRNNNCINLILNERAKMLQFELFECIVEWETERHDEWNSQRNDFSVCGSVDEHLVVILFVFVSYFYFKNSQWMETSSVASRAHTHGERRCVQDEPCKRGESNKRTEMRKTEREATIDVQFLPAI